MTTRFNIVVKKEYEKNGEVKATWPRVGELVQLDNGGFIVEIYTLPKLYVFEDKPRDDRKVSEEATEAVEAEEEDMSGEVPF